MAGMAGVAPAIRDRWECGSHCSRIELAVIAKQWFALKTVYFRPYAQDNSLALTAIFGDKDVERSSLHVAAHRRVAVS
ncbi:hypothetical protein ACOJVU_15395 [Mycobacterium sp. THU-M104]|uniref:hypothetical protein n=1 Tax=Mycobacterium sp. THU-M104 TaxID=3410515 RepID=UPI003B9B1A09